MRLEWIEDILAVAEMGSFNAAAEARFLTPSAFTRRIRSIEQTLGCELFDRSKKPIVLKRHVRDILPELRDAAGTLKRTKQLLSEPERDQTHRITMMCQHALTASVAPNLLTHPSLGENPNVRIRSGRKNECLLELIKQEVDFALIYENNGQLPDLDQDYCARILLGRERFVPVVKADMAKQITAATPNDKIPMIGYPSSIFLGKAQQAALAGRGEDEPQLAQVAETGLSLAVVEFIKLGIGVGWVPKAIVQSELDAGVLVNMEPKLPHFELDVALLRRTNALPRIAEAFWEAMLSQKSGE